MLCDVYMFYYRLLAVCKVSVWRRIRINVYIWICLIVPWFPTYNIMPIFVDTNTDIYDLTLYYNVNIVSGLVVFYYFYITMEFSKILFNTYIPEVDWLRKKPRHEESKEHSGTTSSNINHTIININNAEIMITNDLENGRKSEGSGKKNEYHKKRDSVAVPAVYTKTMNMLRHNRKDTISSFHKIKIIALKSLGHCAFSCIGTYLYICTYLFIYIHTCMYFNVCINACMFVCF
jgi:hypothetical protein